MTIKLDSNQLDDLRKIQKGLGANKHTETGANELIDWMLKLPAGDLMERRDQLLQQELFGLRLRITLIQEKFRSFEEIYEDDDITKLTKEVSGALAALENAIFDPEYKG